MNPSAVNAAIAITTGIDFLTLVLSVSITLFVSGSRWGRVETKMEFMSDRLAKIEGMFTLRVRDGARDGSDQ